MERKVAIITGADGGMGREITRAVAAAGYYVIMVCRDIVPAIPVKQEIEKDIPYAELEIMEADLASLTSVSALADKLHARGLPVTLLMNNAGTMCTCFRQTEDELETTVGVNYVAPYLLTRKLLPLMSEGSRIVNMVSCTYAIGKIEKEFFSKGRKGSFHRIPIYSNTKLALTLFTLELAERLKDKGITVNAADPGIVSTNIITMHQWFDPLTDIFFRPFIRTPRQGADTAIKLLISKDVAGETGGVYAGGKRKKLAERIINHPQRKSLWEDTEAIVKRYFLSILPS